MKVTGADVAMGGPAAADGVEAETVRGKIEVRQKGREGESKLASSVAPDRAGGGKVSASRRDDLAERAMSQD